MKPEDIHLGYLLISTPLPNTYIGGAMVTDGRGLPIEFRYTEPIQPTKIQQVLYGQVLSNYIKQEVILETLMKSLEKKFSYLLVEDDKLLNYPSKDYTILRLGETQASKIGDVGQIEELSPTEVLLQVTQEGSPLRIQLPNRFGEANSNEGQSLDTGIAVQTQSISYDVFIQVGETMDIFEPLKRIEKAMETICQEAGITETA